MMHAGMRAFCLSKRLFFRGIVPLIGLELVNLSCVEAVVNSKSIRPYLMPLRQHSDCPSSLC